MTNTHPRHANAGAAAHRRAALLGLSPHGRTSAGGATRLFPVADSWCALTLCRPDDVSAIPALVQADVSDPWQAVQAWAHGRTASEVVQRGRLLGPAEPRVIGCGSASVASGMDGSVVVDLTSMWAGPRDALSRCQIQGADSAYSAAAAGKW